jgi:hypothetical protein
MHGDKGLTVKEYTINAANPIFCPDLKATLQKNPFRPVANLCFGGQAPSNKQKDGHACKAEDRKRP